MKILFIGDIVGKPGRKAMDLFLRKTQEEHGITFTIANGENAAGGFGVTSAIVEDLFSSGVDVITTGNHVWAKKEALQLVSKEHRLLRPLNYPPGTPGVGSVVMKDRDGHKVAVLNVEGRVFMRPQDCPFRAVEAEIPLLLEETPELYRQEQFQAQPLVLEELVVQQRPDEVAHGLGHPADELRLVDAVH